MKNITYFSGKVKDAMKFSKVLTQVKRKLICVDIDNTIANTNKELEKLGYDTSIYPNPKLNEDFWHSYDGLNCLINAEPIIKTIKITDNLHELGAEIFIATSRNRELANLTYSWLIKNRIVANVYFTSNKLQLDADIYFEDDPAVINQLLSRNKTVIIPAWEYNTGYEHENAIYFNISNLNIFNK